MRAYEIITENDGQCGRITDTQLRDLERFADRLLAKFHIDVDFTKHFKDRVNDARNDPCIVITELQQLFKKIKQDKGQRIRNQGHDTQAVIKDLQRDLNIPAVFDFDENGDVDIRMKTIMRKHDFKSFDPAVVYENEQLTESRSHPIVVVDVQPEYSGVMDGDENPIFTQIIEFVNNSTGPVLMYANAEDTGLTGDSIDGIKQYWNDTICEQNWDDEEEEFECDDSIDWSRFTVVDKGYGYLRGWMDTGVPESTIIKAIRLMYQNRVSDSRELFGGEDDPNYPEQMQQQLGIDVNETSDSISVNWVSVSQLRKFKGAYLVGGGGNECLREIELLASAFNIRLKRVEHLIYG